jgi:hypothetical protein
MKPIFILFGVASVLLSQSANSFDFKGISIGKPFEDQHKRYSCEEKKTPLSDVVCHLNQYQQETVAGTEATAVIVYLVDGNVSTISIFFKSAEYDPIKVALITKYGTGKISSETLTNRMGVQFQNETITWNLPDCLMALRRYAGNANSGSLIIRSNEALTKFIERKREQEKQNANDL